MGPHPARPPAAATARGATVGCEGKILDRVWQVFGTGEAGAGETGGKRMQEAMPLIEEKFR